MYKSLERSNFDDYTCKVTEVINVALKNSNLFNYKNCRLCNHEFK